MGAGKRTSINQLFSKLAELTKYKKKANYVDTRLGDVFGNVADVRLASDELHFESKISVNDGLKETVEWYTKNL